MQRNTSPFALRTRLRQAAACIILLLPLYAYIITTAPTTPSVQDKNNTPSDTLHTDTIHAAPSAASH